MEKQENEETKEKGLAKGKNGIMIGYIAERGVRDELENHTYNGL